MIHARPVGAAALAIALTACSAPSESGNRVSTSPPPGEVAAETTSPSDQPIRFSTDTFADLSEEPVDAGTATLLQRTLDAAAGDNGVTATVMTADGTWTGAAGTADGLEPMRPDAQMAIGSITKTIVAAQVMRLVEAGTLDLDDPAADHLPKKIEFDTNGATVRDLLAMRSGIPNYVDALWDSLSIDTAHRWRVNEMLALVPAGRSPAGKEIDYSDTNYLLLGPVLEKAYHRPLAQILRSGVLGGPGLTRMVYQPTERPTAPMAAPGGAPLPRGRGGGYLPSLAGATAARAAGGIASDSATLARWWGRLCGGQIVSETSFETMIDFGPTHDWYALGIADRSDASPGAVGNKGDHVGFNALAECLPDLRAVVVVLVNDEQADTDLLAASLAATLDDARG
jgi:D-alanyl-D-alanine carboxypeptidase